jgi:hypothetical protein
MQSSLEKSLFSPVSPKNSYSSSAQSHCHAILLMPEKQAKKQKQVKNMAKLPCGGARKKVS